MVSVTNTVGGLCACWLACGAGAAVSMGKTTVPAGLFWSGKEAMPIYIVG